MTFLPAADPLVWLASTTQGPIDSPASTTTKRQLAKVTEMAAHSGFAVELWNQSVRMRDLPGSVGGL